MKEHLFFIETNLQPVEKDLIAKARIFKECFEKLLATTVYYSYCNISKNSIESNEFE